MAKWEKALGEIEPRGVRVRSRIDSKDNRSTAARYMEALPQTRSIAETIRHEKVMESGGKDVKGAG